ncbi:MAG: acylphosphatase [Oscillospiraceae bacterium]|nr:acylphosphatase [Oscillospiraceae bacterium]
MQKIRKHMIFHGEVQEVGFRFASREIARKYGISGWVRNLWDGTVEMEAEGTQADLDCLVRELEQARWTWIEHIDMKEVPAQGGYTFEIR